MLCFFNLAGAVYDPDTRGMDMKSFAEARHQAVRFVGEILRDDPDMIWQGEEVRVEVTDEHQLILFTVIVLGVNAPAMSGKKWD